MSNTTAIFSVSYGNIHSGFIHHSSKLKIIPKSIYRRMDKRNIVYLSDEILRSSKKKNGELIHAATWVTVTDTQLSKRG